MLGISSQRRNEGPGHESGHAGQGESYYFNDWRVIGASINHRSACHSLKPDQRLRLWTWKSGWKRFQTCINLITAIKKRATNAPPPFFYFYSCLFLIRATLNHDSTHTRGTHTHSQRGPIWSLQSSSNGRKKERQPTESTTDSAVVDYQVLHFALH